MNLLERQIQSDSRLIQFELAKQVKTNPYFKSVEGRNNNKIRIDGRDLLNFGSNNYLGLSSDENVIEQTREVVDKYGAGLTGARLLNGTLDIHKELENELAKFYEKEDCLIFPTGYTCNLGFVSAVVKTEDFIVCDEKIHGSLWDGIKLSGASFKRFKHNDPEDLKKIISGSNKKPKMCIIEGVYSLDGKIGRVKELSKICKENDIFVLIDEAHGLGTIGEKGRGGCELDDAIEYVDAITVTFSKSLASCGGALIATKKIVDFVKVNSRPFIFTASNTPGSIAAARASLKRIIDNPELISELQDKKMYFYNKIKDLGITIHKNESPILTIPIGSDFDTLYAWKLLFNRGVFCNPILSPSAPKGGALLRFSINVRHTYEEINEAATIINHIKKFVHNENGK